jgi:hypothetical protein
VINYYLLLIVQFFLIKHCITIRCDIETNECTQVYYSISYTRSTSYMFRPLILIEVHYKEYLHRNITYVFERVHRYKILNFKNSAWFKIHIKYQ